MQLCMLHLYLVNSFFHRVTGIQMGKNMYAKLSTWQHEILPCRLLITVLSTAFYIIYSNLMGLDGWEM